MTASTVVNLAPVLDQVVLPFLGALATGLGTVAVSWLTYLAAKYLHLRISTQTAENVDALLDRAITKGQHDAQTVVDANSSVDVKNAVVASAVAYAEPKIGPEMKTLGWDPTTLADRVVARLPLAPSVASVLAADPAQVAPVVF